MRYWRCCTNSLIAIDFLSQATTQPVPEVPRTPTARSTPNDGLAQGLIGTATETPSNDAPKTPNDSEKQSSPESGNTQSSTSTVFITDAAQTPGQETPAQAASKPRFYEERGDFVRDPLNRAIAIVDPHRRTQSEELGTEAQGDGEDEVRRNSEPSVGRRGLDPESRVYEPSRLGAAIAVVERGSGIPGPSSGGSGAMERQRRTLLMGQAGQGPAGSGTLPGRMGPIIPGVRTGSAVDPTTSAATQAQRAPSTVSDPSARGPAAAPTTRRPSTRMQPLATQGRPPAPQPRAPNPRFTTTTTASQLPRPAGPGNRMANSIWSDTTSTSTTAELDAPKTLERAPSPVGERERGKGWLGRGKGDDDDRGDGRGGGRGGGNRGGRGGGRGGAGGGRGK